MPKAKIDQPIGKILLDLVTLHGGYGGYGGLGGLEGLLLINSIVSESANNFVSLDLQVNV